MPSWNEKAHVIPTVNVNLATCDCSDTRRLHCRASASADGTCPTKPALIPCPIPRSFEAVVRLGECTCPRSIALRAPSNTEAHRNDCPARPIRVSCSISGETWAESEVADILEPGITSADMFRACRDRWALVKALVMGKQSPREVGGTSIEPVETWWALVQQRAAVFAALANEARLEQELHDAQHHSHALMPVVLTESDGRIGGKPERRHSAAFLAAYVERLIEQVGVLGVGQ